MLSWPEGTTTFQRLKVMRREEGIRGVAILMMALCLSIVYIRAAPPRGATSMNDVCDIPSLTSFSMLHLFTYYLDTPPTAWMLYVKVPKVFSHRRLRRRRRQIASSTTSSLITPPPPPATATAALNRRCSTQARVFMGVGWRSMEAAIFPPLISHSPNHFLLHLLLLLPIKCCACVG